MKRKLSRLTRGTRPVSLVNDGDLAPAFVPAPRRLRRKTASVDVVADIERRTADAKALADVAGQNLLQDARTNPAVRAHAVELHNAEHKRQITAASDQRMRRIDVNAGRAAHAARSLEVIQMAEEKNSPAHSVLALHDGRKRFMTASMICSTLLSVGSATGIMALAQKHGAPGTTGDVVGAVAELGLTGISTMAVLYRTHLTSHRSMTDEGGSAHRIDGAWQDAGLWFLTVAPLVAGVAANAVAHGAVGIFCSVGAVMFSVFSYIVSDRSSHALRTRAAEVSKEDKEELFLVATGQDAQVIVDAEQVTDEPPTTLDEIKAHRDARLSIVAPAKADDTEDEGDVSADVEPPVKVKVSRHTASRPEDHHLWNKVYAETMELAAKGTMPGQKAIAEAFGMKNKVLAGHLQRAVYAALETRPAGGE